MSCGGAEIRQDDPSIQANFLDLDGNRKTVPGPQTEAAALASEPGGNGGWLVCVLGVQQTSPTMLTITISNVCSSF